MRSPIKRDVLLALAIGASVALSLIVAVAWIAGGLSHANCNHL